MAWLAVQAHTTTLPVALTLFAVVLVAGALAGQTVLTGGDTAERGSTPSTGRHVLRRLGIVLIVIAVLQVPWLVYRVSVAAPSSTPMGDSIAAVTRHPLRALRPAESVRALSRAVHTNTATGLPAPALACAVVAGAVLLAWRSRDRVLLAVAAGPLVFAFALYAVWQGPLNENYWYLALSTPAAVAALAWLAMLPPSMRLTACAALLALLVWSQPSRAALAHRTLREPVYGALISGARAAIASGYPIREVRTTFAMPPGIDPAYIYSLLGGRLDGDAPQRLVVGDSGRIHFEAVE
jgi:hypothetical protein